MYAGADLETPVRVSANADSYNVQHGVTRLPETPDVPYLDVAAVLSKNERKLTLFCVNRHLNQDISHKELKSAIFAEPMAHK